MLTTPNKDSWINKLFHTLETFDLPEHVGHKTLFTRDSLLATAGEGFPLSRFTITLRMSHPHGARIGLNNRLTFGARRLLHRILPDRWKEGIVVVVEVEADSPSASRSRRMAKIGVSRCLRAP